jgi:hypothetical protein
MRGISIRDGKLSVVEFKDSYKFMSEGVADKGEGTFTTAFRLPSPRGGKRSIDAWVNEEMVGTQPSVGVTFPFKYVFFGPMVITAADGPKTVGMTQTELNLFALTEPCVFHFEKMIFTVPVIVLPKAYRKQAAHDAGVDIYLF